MKLQESGEMYLENILILSEKSDMVRSVDLSKYMSFSKPSVSRGLGILKDGGYITIKENGSISLTDLGLKKAKKIYEKHKVLSSLLIKIGVDESTAINDACKIEHVISDETFNKIRQLSCLDF